ncbi:protein mono-ADP-ribosyltransferase PARP15 isoform X1 [Oncorhynchus tshawytscha]|uniref:Poly [ADP-ribose] polymerase n=2 Tax=Oncorhynchus tshawytscha TaxID=74940 RepID=A0A8C8HPP1_ONCTS|nr:protein mono-ADP-ribosyltransferase PARP15 isoform X1 [Oncorhynchus tshawytscha]
MANREVSGMENIIITNKMKLIDWLRVDPMYILQHLHCKGIIKDREYQSLMSVPEPENKVIKLLDKIIGKKEITCCQFLDTLKEHDVNETYPVLQQWITTLDLPAQQDKLPQDWAAMPATSPVQLYSIHPGSPEYDEVQGLFQNTCPDNEIKKIERVQNPNLWKSFQIKKKDISDRNDRFLNERRLFHGTSHTNVGHINDHGFNRSYAGKNDAEYGNGTYFAVNASYSAADEFSKPDGEGRKLMYLCRVLTGHFTKGERGMIEPPFKDGSDIRRYDSTTNEPSDPTEFVVFHDCQAYPEYLITFLRV